MFSSVCICEQTFEHKTAWWEAHCHLMNGLPEWMLSAMQGPGVIKHL